MGTKYSLRTGFASNSVFRERLQTAMVIVSNQVLLEAIDDAHPNKSTKRWALASAVQIRSSALIDQFALAVIDYPGSGIGTALDSQYDGNVNITPDTVNQAGYSDADVASATASAWSNVAGVLPTD